MEGEGWGAGGGGRRTSGSGAGGSFELAEANDGHGDGHDSDFDGNDGDGDGGSGTGYGGGCSALLSVTPAEIKSGLRAGAGGARSPRLSAAAVGKAGAGVSPYWRDAPVSPSSPGKEDGAGAWGRGWGEVPSPPRERKWSVVVPESPAKVGAREEVGLNKYFEVSTQVLPSFFFLDCRSMSMSYKVFRDPCMTTEKTVSAISSFDYYR